MNAPEAKAEPFDVFLCHNSEDKPAVRQIAQKLAQENIKAWLDEADIRGGDFWHTAIGQQIETAKSAAVFIGQYGVGPWQNREIIALLDQFDRRGCPVIPVILASAPAKATLPWSLVGLHCVDFRAVDSHPLKRLIWAITDERPQELSHIPASEKPATMREAVKGRLLPSDQDHAEGHVRRFGSPEVAKKRLYPPLTQPPDPEQAAQLGILRCRVKEYWVDGVLKHSLHNEVLISLGKRPMHEAVDEPWKYTVEVADAANSAPLDDRGVSDIYDATGLLLILGEPGSGKTTTLLDLARTLLERAGDDLKERVPVVLNLSSWKKNQPLADWISSELSKTYWVPRKIARFWLEQGYVLPLLDGLDEVETRMQPDCVAAINAFVKESNPSGLVVCCRLAEYQWLPERLTLNGAICLEPLSPEEVSKYLDRGGAKLAALREAINSDPVLQELAQTPLMLSIMSLACQGLGGDKLARQKGDSLEERRKQIFGLYVERMFQRRATTFLAFSRDKTIGWLSWLARKMRDHSQSVFLVEALQPTWLGRRVQRVVYITTIVSCLGLIVGSGFGLSVEMATRSIGKPMYGLLAALLAGLVACGYGLGVVELTNLIFVEVSWNWSRFWERAILPLIVCSIIMIAQTRGSGYIANEVLIKLCLFLILAIFSGFTGGIESSKASYQGLKLSWKNSLVAFFGSCLAMGLLIGVAVGLAAEQLNVGLNVGLSAGLCIGLCIGLSRGGLTVIQHYALRLALRLTGFAPFKLSKFLDHCTRLILLKKVGGGYIFIHRMLLDYFADMAP